MLLVALPAVLACSARANDEIAGGAPAPAWSDSLLLDAPDFEALRPDLLTMDTARVAATAWALVPRLVELDRPDLLVDYLQFWQDRCGDSEPLTRTRILAAIWDGAFDESLYDASIAYHLDDWELREPDRLTEGRRGYDAFTVAFADQLLPHQVAGSLPQYFCLLYSDRPQEAADLLAEDGLADTWLRWYVEHPGEAPGGQVIPAGREIPEAGPRGPLNVYLTVGGWWPQGNVALAGDHVLVGGLLEQRGGIWFLRIPVEVRLGRTLRPYQVGQRYDSGFSDRFDALYLGVEAGRTVVAVGPANVDAFAGLGYDGVRPILKQDQMLGALNANIGIGLRWSVPGRPYRLGADCRREWLGRRNEGPDSLSGRAWSIRLAVGIALRR